MVLISDASFPLDSAHSRSLKNRALIQTTAETIDELSKMDQQAAEREGGLRPALIVVDMQNDSIHPQGCNERLGFSHLTDAERSLVISNNQRLSNFMREKGWPVIFVNLAHRLDLSDSASPKMVHRNKHLPSGTGRRTEGSWGAQTVTELAPQEKDYVLIKKGQSAFGFTPLHRLLRNLAVNRCVVTGGAVTGCVSDTIREGAGLGYRTVVVSDATYPPGSPHLAWLAGRTEIASTDEVMRVLQSEKSCRIEGGNK
jgi:nicotinamidase-related amidase